ncbi:hypothetical protein HDU96_001274 [Phlyctochytrium bullatum]|nr:hypothetical protein HDU96_001274 [Phlyctochytrium bullatum]
MAIQLTLPLLLALLHSLPTASQPAPAVPLTTPPIAQTTTAEDEDDTSIATFSAKHTTTLPTELLVVIAVSLAAMSLLGICVTTLYLATRARRQAQADTESPHPLKAPASAPTPMICVPFPPEAHVPRPAPRHPPVFGAPVHHPTRPAAPVSHPVEMPWHVAGAVGERTHAHEVVVRFSRHVAEMPRGTVGTVVAETETEDPPRYSGGWEAAGVPAWERKEGGSPKMIV